MTKYLAPTCALVLAAAAAAQTGRNVNLLQPTFLGRTATFEVTYPTTAAGNFCAFLWSLPGSGGAINAPGITVNGSYLGDLASVVSAYATILSATGSESYNLPIPTASVLLGYAWDLQTADLDFTNLALSFADNELSLAITAGIGNVDLAIATTTSLTAGNNDLSSLDDSTIGTPTSKNIPPHSAIVVRHRGEEGFVEGYQGTFSSTSHNSDIDSVSARRAGRRTLNGAYQTLVCPNGFDITIQRDLANPKQFSLLSYNRATGAATVIPGSVWTDTGTAAAPAQQFFYFGVSRDGVWGAIYVKDSNTTTPGFAPMVWAFRTDGTAPVVDITPAGTTTASSFFDGTLAFSNDFLLASGSGGVFWTSATNPTQLQSLALPNTTASNAPNIWAFPFSWRIAPAGDVVYLPLGSDAAASRAEMDIARLTNNAGTPAVVNYTQFPVATGIAEFGYAAISPSTANNSSQGIKSSVSPDGSKFAFLAATTTTTAFPGLYVADGTPNPTLYTVPGATYYSEVAFVNNTTVLFFAGTSNTLQSFYQLDLTAGAQLGTITQIGTAADIRTRGQFWSLNKNWWYFIRSNSASTLNDIVGVNCATGAVFSVTGTEFGTPGPVGTIRTGSFNTTADPWFALEMQLRRAPVGDYAYFTARREIGGGVFEDANVFRFDIENGGQAVQVTNNAGTGAGATTVRNIESLTISADGMHLAWGERLGTASSSSEDVFHFDLGTNTLTQCSVSTATGQTITDGSIRFVGGSDPYGLVWSIGTGSTTVPTANARVEYAPFGAVQTPVLISASPSGTRLYQVIGTHD